MNDLFAPRRSRRSPLVWTGTGLFALLAVVSAVDALRGAAPSPAEGAVSVQEAVVYRAGAAFLSAALAVWIFVAGGPRRDDRPTLLR
jgi:hypothetical protein